MDTNVPCLPVRVTFVADTICVRDPKNVSQIFVRNILCPQKMFPRLRGMDTKQMFCVPLVCPHKKHHEQQCVLVCHHLNERVVARITSSTCLATNFGVASCSKMHVAQSRTEFYFLQQFFSNLQLIARQVEYAVVIRATTRSTCNATMPRAR